MGAFWELNCHSSYIKVLDKPGGSVEIPVESQQGLPIPAKILKQVFPYCKSDMLLGAKQLIWVCMMATDQAGTGCKQAFRM
jgi:hypothetical protein